jgi:hypothetical protein
MDEWNPTVDAFGECARPDCGEPCPWDMPAIMLGESTVCCSPDCATTVLELMATAPDAVALHDPQFVVDRTDRLNVTEETVDIHRPVVDHADAETAISEFAAMYGGRFRVERDA